MEQKHITLEMIYSLMKNMQEELHDINNRLDWSDEFTEEENKEFEEGTRQAWKEIDEGKYTQYDSPEEFLKEIDSLKKNAKNKRN